MIKSRVERFAREELLKKMIFFMKEYKESVNRKAAKFVMDGLNIKEKDRHSFWYSYGLKTCRRALNIKRNNVNMDVKHSLKGKCNVK